MKSRTFNSMMPKYNEIWAGKVLKMKLNDSHGPDLIDDEKAVEIKFKLFNNNKYTHKCWQVLRHQLDYNKNWEEIYWGFGFYYMNKNVEEVDEKDIFNLENLVNSRKLYLVNWDWIKQFPKYSQNGQTHISFWDNELIFPKFSKLPKVESYKEVEGGKVFFTEGINPERFSKKMFLDESEDKDEYSDVPF